ncbi:hypothetical protein H703_00144 [Bartonella bacilliformis Ver075]|nr:hypothetical protein H703_00144 [Bartonella bacilliformis Ver075]
MLSSAFLCLMHYEAPLSHFSSLLHSALPLALYPFSHSSSLPSFCLPLSLFLPSHTSLPFCTLASPSLTLPSCVLLPPSFFFLSTSIMPPFLHFAPLLSFCLLFSLFLPSHTPLPFLHSSPSFSHSSLLHSASSIIFLPLHIHYAPFLHFAPLLSFCLLLSLFLPFHTSLPFCTLAPPSLSFPSFLPHSLSHSSPFLAFCKAALHLSKNKKIT